MNEYKELNRLITNIRSRRFKVMRYLRQKKYYGLELEVDSLWADGGFGMGVSIDGNWKYWIFYKPSLKTLNINGRPADEILATIKKT